MAGGIGVPISTRSATPQQPHVLRHTHSTARNEVLWPGRPERDEIGDQFLGNPKITTASPLCKGSEAILTLNTLPLARNEAMRTQATLLYSRNEPMLTLTALPPSRNEANDLFYLSTPERSHALSLPSGFNRRPVER